ncbi:expressed unknown protein [Seminavis robusta]|uniref:Uncharacterized protein n=1 Tax=Seminavis robusta TaxID=568900 RepID=A0A9N8D948_9STRA|nr:expressed unknown protein [Seminavis robusta]|eukprot:Sro42_g025500.1 n/a (139) ;mRNA; f:36881-37297
MGTHSRTSLFETSVRNLFVYFVRDPAARNTVLSFDNFREESIEGIQCTEETLLDRIGNFSSGNFGTILKDGQGGFQLQFAALEPIPYFAAWDPSDRETVQNADKVQAIIHRMMRGYNFMIVVERMEESLVALALLLDP